MATTAKRRNPRGGDRRPVVSLLTRAAIALTLLAALVAGCGNDEDSTATTTTAAPTTSGTTTSSTTMPSSTTTTTTSSTTTTTTTSTTTTSGSTRIVEVYFSTGDGTDCTEVTAFDRSVDASIGPARAAFTELVGGPTAAEQDDGAGSFFSETTADALLSVALSGGVLTVDLADIRSEISNAGTSCGSGALVSSLTATAFQFPTVDSARFLFDGSCEDFGGFIQTDRCQFDRIP